MVDRELAVSRTIFTGAVAGMAGRVVEMPFDTVKVRVQADGLAHPNGTPEFKNAWDCFIKTLQREGFLALFRGLPSPMVGSALESGSIFVFFNAAKRLFHKEGDHQPELSLPQIFVAGSLAGIGTAVLITPCELIKCRMQVQATPSVTSSISTTTAIHNNNHNKNRNNTNLVWSSGSSHTHLTNPSGLVKAREYSSLITASAPRYRNTLHCIYHTIREEGLIGIYRGFWSTFSRELVGSALWFGIYEMVCRSIARRRTSDAGILTQTLAGGLAGCVYWAVPYPIDTLKSKVQVAQRHQRHSVMVLLAKVLKEEGVKGLYRGIGPTMMRAFPGSAVTLVTYEQITKLIDHYSTLNMELNK
jgi:ornithine carrier protein